MSGKLQQIQLSSCKECNDTPNLCKVITEKPLPRTPKYHHVDPFFDLCLQNRCARHSQTYIQIIKLFHVSSFNRNFRSKGMHRSKMSITITKILRYKNDFSNIKYQRRIPYSSKCQKKQHVYKNPIPGSESPVLGQPQHNNHHSWQLRSGAASSGDHDESGIKEL